MCGLSLGGGRVVEEPLDVRPAGVEPVGQESAGGLDAGEDGVAFGAGGPVGLVAERVECGCGADGVAARLDALRPLLRDFAGIPPAALPADLEGELRPYQRQGVDWLVFLRRLKICPVSKNITAGSSLTICLNFT